MNKAINHIHWCGAKELKALGLVEASEEYQIYGIIDNPVAHKAVPLSSVQLDIMKLPRDINVAPEAAPYKINPSPQMLRWSDMSIEEKYQSVECAKRVGQAFGGDLGLVVSVFYLSIATSGLSRAADILKSLERAFHVPLQLWEGDASIMHDRFDSARATEVQHAVQAMRTLVRRASHREDEESAEGERIIERKLMKKPNEVKWKVWEKYREMLGYTSESKQDDEEAHDAQKAGSGGEDDDKLA